MYNSTLTVVTSTSTTTTTRRFLLNSILCIESSDNLSFWSWDFWEEWCKTKLDYSQLNIIGVFFVRLWNIPSHCRSSKSSIKMPGKILSPVRRISIIKVTRSAKPRCQLCQLLPTFPLQNLRSLRRKFWNTCWLGLGVRCVKMVRNHINCISPPNKGCDIVHDSLHLFLDLHRVWSRENGREQAVVLRQHN